MYSSTYLNWFRRLLILGAAVAGLTASAAGARVDPGFNGVAYGQSVTQAMTVSRPPDVRDVATSVSTAIPDALGRYVTAHPSGYYDVSSSVYVSSPPDVQDAAAALHTTAAGLKADGLRWQGIAQVYQQQQSAAAPALRPDDRAGPLGVGEPTSVPVSGGSGFDWSDWAIGIGTGLGLALLLGVGLMVGRQQRNRVQPA